MKKTYGIDDKDTLAYRVRYLRESMEWSQTELAQRTQVNRSKISRLESGATTNISLSLLASLAQAFHVSTDYLLGLTSISTPKSYGISQLGLSEESVRRLLTKRIDPEMLNRLLEHDDFPKVCVLMRSYFDDTIARGILGRNQMIDLATAPLTELMSAEPEKRAEILKDRSFLQSQKIQPSEADTEKIRDYLMKILREIKADMAVQKPTGLIASAEAMKAIREALPDKSRSEITADDVSDAVVAYVGRTIQMDENTSALLHKVAKQMLEQIVAQQEEV